MTEQSNLKQRVLVADKVHQAGIDMLQERFEVDVKTGLAEDELIQIIGGYHALIVRSATKVTARVIEKAYNLKVIARAGAGLDNIDIAAARAQGIEVVNSPNANTQAVAEHTMGLILALARRLPEADSSLKKGQWNKAALMGTGLHGKTLGIVGFGRIGREVAHRALAFGMNIVVNQRRLTPELTLEEGVEAVDLFDLLKVSDFVTLHVPLKPETEGLIRKGQLALMKAEAYLINTARGGIVDETALLEALNEGRLAGAALDVFTQEPAIDSELVQHPRVIATPHIAASTGDAQRAAAATVAQKILETVSASVEDNPLSLRVLPIEKVLPHEEIDPNRVQHLAARFKVEKVLKNPPVVTAWEDHYVVLDGATRVTALREMGYRHIVAQVVPHTDKDLTLQGWNYAVQGLRVENLLDLIESLPDVQCVAADTDYLQDKMLELGGLGYLILPDQRLFILQPVPGSNRLDALNKLARTLIESSQVARTLVSDFDAARLEFPHIMGLFVFPSFTVTQILQISSAGKFVPAGITRFIIPGRVLRLNLDLIRLEQDESLAAKSTWLNQVVQELIVNHKVRYYEEPIYLLDE